MKNEQEPEWKKYARLARHYKAIGQTEIYLTRDEDAPWCLASHVEAGCTHRLSIPVSMAFRGTDIKSGLTFRWHFDIEKREANGSGTFLIDVLRIRQVREMLPDAARKDFSRLLKETAKAVRKQGDEYQSAANGQYAMAMELEAL